MEKYALYLNETVSFPQRARHVTVTDLFGEVSADVDILRIVEMQKQSAYLGKGLHAECLCRGRELLLPLAAVSSMAEPELQRYLVWFAA